MIKPLFDRVVLRPQEQNNTSKILVPQKAPDNVGIVVAVGNTKDVKNGDKVIFNKYAATTISIDNSDYLIIKEIDILAIINEENK